MSEEHGVHVQGLTKRYGSSVGSSKKRAAAQSHTALKDVTLDIKRGEFFTLLGPSGCGKSTTLRSIAGLETPDEGSIRINDTEVFGNGVVIPPNRRSLGMVFQSYAIWPHMNVYQNIEFPLAGLPISKTEKRKRVLEAISLVGMSDIVDRSATKLSGGQQQRVAVARAVVRNVDVLLLDEPLSNLDAKLRGRMRDELIQLQRRLGMTTIFVTHDQGEALTMSDRIAILNEGRVVEVGTPEQLYRRPKSTFTAEFMGESQLLSGDLVGPRTIRTVLGDVLVSNTALNNSKATLLVRPQSISVRRVSHGSTADSDGVNGIVVRSRFHGTFHEVTVDVSGKEIIARSDLFDLAEGDEVRCAVRREEAWAMNND